MTLLHWRWLARGLFFIYCANGFLIFFSLETALFGMVYVLFFVVACRTVVLLQALMVFSWLELIAVCLLVPTFLLFASGLAIGVSALLCLQMHNPMPEPITQLEVEYGC
jgi:hypothetical protein